MKLSELITHLEAQKSKYGDLIVFVYDGEDGPFEITRNEISHDPEWNYKEEAYPAKIVIQGWKSYNAQDD